MATLQATYSLRYGSETLKGRTAAAIVRYARYVLGAQPADEALITWAKRAIRDPEAEAELILWGVVDDTAVQTAGDEVSDDALRAVVETLVNSEFKNS